MPQPIASPRDAERACVERRAKILHVLDHSVPLHSGYAFRSESICQAQQRRGWQPLVVTSPKHEASWRGERTPDEEIGGVRYFRAGPSGWTGWPIAAELLLMRRLAGRLDEVVRSERPSLLHAHSPVLNAIPALRVGRRAGLPVVYEVRSLWEEAAATRGTYAPGSWRYRLVRGLETWVCRRADEVTVLCEGLGQEFVGRGVARDRISIVRNGVDPALFGDRIVPDAHYRAAWELDGRTVVGFIGSFSHYEGLDLLLQATARLAARRRSLALLLVGGGEMEPALKNRIRQLGLGQTVIMPGRVPHRRVPGVYALVDVFVYPRASTRLTEIVTPLKPLEAMAMGKVVIASDIGGHRELIQHGQTGWLFTPGDVRALVAALERVLEDVDLRESLQARARARVGEAHTWERTVEAYSRAYARALERTRVAR